MMGLLEDYLAAAAGTGDQSLQSYEGSDLTCSQKCFEMKSTSVFIMSRYEGPIAQMPIIEPYFMC